MKKFGAYLSILGLLFQTSAPAWVGGPYSGNTYDGFTGGTYGGTIRGPSTSGIFKFSQQGTDAYVSPFGDSIVYNKGMAYYGECYGQVDFDSKLVSGVTNGANNGANLNDPNASPQFRNLFGSGFGVQNGTGAGIGTANQFGGPTYANGAGGTINSPNAASKVAAANSFWNGKITKSKQTVRFSAVGEMSFFGNASEVVESITVVSSGDFQEPRFDIDTGLNLIGTGNTPGTGTSYKVSGAENNYPNIQSKIKIRVYGSRTSIAGFAGPTAYAG